MTTTSPRVLLVDDSPALSVLLTGLLAPRGVEVVTRTDGQGGIDAARNQSFDLVLLDLGLPGMDGFEVCRRLKADTALKNIPVIILTGRDDTVDKVKAFEIGATDYVCKAGNHAEMLARILSTIREKKTQDKAAAATRRERERSQTELLRISKAVDSASDAICVVDSSNRAIYLNPAFTQLFGLTFDALESPGRQRSLFAKPGVWESICDACLGGFSWKGEVEMFDKEGRLAPILCRADAIQDEQQNLLGVVFIYTDITQRKRLERDLLHAANYDPLTGLANRRRFEENLRGAVRRARAGLPGYLLYLDLDKFKVINEALGHKAGDRLLIEVTSLLHEHVRGSEVISRLGADVFTMILDNPDEAEASQLSQRLLTVLGEYRFQADERVFITTGSIGMVHIDGSAAAEDLLARADSACHVAKSRGGNGLVVYHADNADMERLVRDAEWCVRASEAIAESRLELWLQPVVPLQPEQPAHFEVLVRLRETDGSVVSPYHFLPALERFGKMLDLDRYVLRHAVDLLAANPGMRLAVNLSAKSLNDATLPEAIARLLETAAVDAERLSFEITETDVIQNLAEARSLIGRIRDLGCAFALDDFGSGASSMMYLRNLPVDYLKIDGSFVKEIDADAVSRALVKSMAEVARILGKKTVAEHVSSEGVLRVVRELGIDYVQGWHVSEPGPPRCFHGRPMPDLVRAAAA
jgi:diguanylate cyclase (GGDEF)-like protein/PAS domain S-box-containing protein